MSHLVIILGTSPIEQKKSFSFVELISVKNLPGPTAQVSKVSQIFDQFFSFAKLLVVVLGPVGVEELVSVEDAPSTRFARYGIEINILTCP